MSKISTIHDNLLALISTNLGSEYKKLPNPYIIDDNNELYLTKGYGLAIGPGARTDRLVSCRQSWQRDFTLYLTQQITTTDHNTDDRETIIKAMLEDHFTLFDALESDSTLSGSAIRAQMESDSGITILDLESARYLLLEIDVIAEYLENV